MRKEEICEKIEEYRKAAFELGEERDKTHQVPISYEQSRKEILDGMGELKKIIETDEKLQDLADHYLFEWGQIVVDLNYAIGKSSYGSRMIIE